MACVFSDDSKAEDPNRLEIKTIEATFTSALGGTARIDESLSEALWEVQSLQNSLLQANNDAMRLSARILQVLSVPHYRNQS
jgi:hypothetical protein